VGGVATLRLASLATGPHSITAYYLGDAANVASTSNVVSHTVLPTASTTVTLSSSANPVLQGTTVNFSIAVAGTAPSGTVTLQEGTTVLGSAALTAGGASISLGNLAAGLHSLTAYFPGDASNPPASSAPLFQSVTLPPILVPLSVARTGSGSGTVTSSPAGVDCGTTCSGSYLAGTTVTLTATATPGSVFAGWTGACAGFATCSVPASAAASVTATFVLQAATPLATVNPPSAAFGGQSMNTTTPAITVSLVNTGTATVSVLGFSFSSPQFTQTNNCPSTLAVAAGCTVNLFFTPAVEGTVNGQLTVQTGAGNALVTLSGTGEKSLVTHYYRSILRRAPDAGGKVFWDGEATRMQSLGVNVNETWYSMAGSFYTSAEYLAFNRDNTGFVTDLYNTFFNRPPDGAGLAFWFAQLASGMPREVALVSFMFSTEFVNFTQAIFGNTAVRKEIDTVVDFYRGLLGRLPDNAGFTFWVQQFRTAQCQGAAAVTAQAESISSFFALSTEYANRARNNSQYVGDLYNAFLRRGGDLAGVQFWINQVATGAQTREQVRKQFVASVEFQGRVQAIITQGCLP
jgi:hypothetical protein